MPNYKYYVIYCLLTVVLLLGAAAVTNWLIDPYWRYGSKDLKHFAKKPLAADYRRKFKVDMAQHVRPQSVVLGTSRVENGIGPANPNWRFLPAFNLALPGASLGVLWDGFKKVHANSPVKQLVVGLDMIMFAYPVFKPEKTYFFIDNPKVEYKPDSHIKTLLSFDTLKNSYKTLLLQDKLTCYTKYGFNDLLGCPDFDQRNFANGQYAAFEFSEKFYTTGGYGPCWQYSATDAQYYNQLMRPILEFAHRENIELTFYISPVHARQLELLDAMGLWPAYEFWKRTLVNVNTAVAKQYQQPPFPLWDFSGYNHITTEPVPRPDDKKTRMRYYMDSSHYYVVIGDQILARLLSDQVAPQPAFGQQLTSDNLDQWLADIRQSRQHYRQTHPIDVADIQQIVAAHERRSCDLTHAN